MMQEAGKAKFEEKELGSPRGNAHEQGNAAAFQQNKLVDKI